jgi:hypothetical protein
VHRAIGPDSRLTVKSLGPALARKAALVRAMSFHDLGTLAGPG